MVKENRELTFKGTSKGVGIRMALDKILGVREARKENGRTKANMGKKNMCLM